MLGKNIKRKREEMHLTQEELAEKLGVIRTTVSRWEIGERSPSDPKKKAIAKILNTTVAELMTEQDTEQISKSDLEPFNPAHRTVVKVLPKEFAACCGSGIDWGTGAVEFDYAYTISDPDLSRHSPIVSMTVSGDSMEPYIEEGDVVMFSENPGDVDFIPNGCTVVVNYDERMLVRGLYRKDGEVVLKAWNKLYDDIHIGAHEYFKICGRVLKIHPQPKEPPMMM